MDSSVKAETDDVSPYHSVLPEGSSATNGQVQIGNQPLGSILKASIKPFSAVGDNSKADIPRKPKPPANKPRNIADMYTQVNKGPKSNNLKLQSETGVEETSYSTVADLEAGDRASYELVMLENIEYGSRAGHSVGVPVVHGAVRVVDEDGEGEDPDYDLVMLENNVYSGSTAE